MTVAPIVSPFRYRSLLSSGLVNLSLLPSSVPPLVVSCLSGHNLHFSHSLTRITVCRRCGVRVTMPHRHPSAHRNAATRRIEYHPLHIYSLSPT